MITALILAGGRGERMQHELPKQFIEVSGKPVLAYTLESFQKHPMIDAIEVVCLENWKETVWQYRERYGIAKLRWVIGGGNTTQESIRNGVFHLEGELKGDDIVVIHDGIRPLVDVFVISDVIEVCLRHGNAITSTPFNEQIFLVGDTEGTSEAYIPREKIRRVSTPQAYRFDLLLSKYQEAFARKVGIYGSAYTNTMMVDLGVKLYFARGSDRNIKLTTPADLELFKAYLKLFRGDNADEAT